MEDGFCRVMLHVVETTLHTGQSCLGALVSRTAMHGSCNTCAQGTADVSYRGAGCRLSRQIGQFVFEEAVVVAGLSGCSGRVRCCVR